MTPVSDNPDCIVICMDDLGREALHIYRNLRANMAAYGSDQPGGNAFPFPRMPNLDKLAENGVTFPCFHTSPVCSTTRACALTGLYPWQNWHGGVQRGSDASFPSFSSTFTELGNQTQPTIRSIAHFARANGYLCLATGKWHLFQDEGDATVKGSGGFHATRVMGFHQWRGTPRNPVDSFYDFDWYDWVTKGTIEPTLETDTGEPYLRRINLDTALGEPWLTGYNMREASILHVDALEGKAGNPSDSNPEGLPIFHWIALNTTHIDSTEWSWPPQLGYLGFGGHNFLEDAPERDWHFTRVRAQLEDFDAAMGRFFTNIGYDPDNPTADDPVVFFWGDNGTFGRWLENLPGTTGSSPYPATEQKYNASHPGWASDDGDSFTGTNTDTADNITPPYITNKMKGSPNIDGVMVGLVVAGNSDYVGRIGEVDNHLLDLVDLFPTLATVMVSDSTDSQFTSRVPDGRKATGSVVFTDQPNDAQTITIADRTGLSVTFELDRSNVVDDGNVLVPIQEDFEATGRELARAINASALRLGAQWSLENSGTESTVTLTSWDRDFLANQEVVLGLATGGSDSGAITVSGMTDGITQPPATAGISFAHRLLNTSNPSTRDFSANGIKFAPNGVFQKRRNVDSRYVQAGGPTPETEERWTLIRHEGTDVEDDTFELYNSGAGTVDQQATGSITFSDAESTGATDLATGNTVRISDNMYWNRPANEFNGPMGKRLVLQAGAGPGVISTSGNITTRGFLLGGSFVSSMSNAFDQFVLAQAAGEIDITPSYTPGSDTMTLEADVASYGSNENINKNGTTLIQFTGMGSAGAAPGSVMGQSQDIHETYDLNDEYYLAAHQDVPHPKLAELQAEEDAFRRRGRTRRVTRRSQINTTGYGRSQILVR